MKTNTQYKNEALAALKGNWSPAVLATVVYFLVTMLIVSPSEVPLLNGTLTDISAMAVSGDIAGMMDAYSSVTSWTSLGSLLQIFVYSVLSLGIMNAFLKLLREGDDRLTSNMFQIAFKNYWHKVWGVFLMHLFTFLWTLLFIIPGIVKAFS